MPDTKNINQRFELFGVHRASYEYVAGPHQSNVVVGCPDHCHRNVRSKPADFACNCVDEPLFVSARAHRHKAKVTSGRLSLCSYGGTTALIDSRNTALRQNGCDECLGLT